MAIDGAGAPYHDPVLPLLRLRWIAGHVLAIVTVVAFVSFGFWQLRRHDEMVALRNAVAAGQELSPIPIGEAPPGSYRQVFATGTYDASLQTKVLRGQAGISGYHVLIPFRIEGGAAVLVDRGWISLDAAIPAPYSGVVSISGTLWPAEEGASVPESLAPAVRRIDPEIQQAFAEYELIAEYLLLSGADAGATVEPVMPTRPEIGLGPHLGYAAQWFLFATVVIVGYPLLLRRVSAADSRSRRG